MRSKRFSLNRRPAPCRRALHSYRAIFSWLVLLALIPSLHAESILSHPSFLGQSTCSSSACHGGAGELHNQFTRWSKLDYHTRAYATLTLARSARIADNLKIADATQSPRCTVCHAPFQTLSDHAKNSALDPAVGVSCETCHGPAENWLLSHTRTDFSHADRVHSGMRDLVNLYTRANTCVACHQVVPAELLRAGHPELIFELDGQSVSQPKHWREKPDWSGAQTWLVGQAVALREMSAELAAQNNPAQSEHDRWAALLWLLQTIAPAPPEQTAANATAAQSWSDQLAQATATNSWPANAARKYLDRVADTAADFRDTTISRAAQARRAERLVLALDRLLTRLNDDPTALRANAALNQLFKDAQSLPDFDPATFATHLEAFQKVLPSP